MQEDSQQQLRLCDLYLNPYTILAASSSISVSERMESPDEDTAHSDLSLSFSEDLVPLRPPKPAGQTFISFSGLLDPPLLLHEDLKEGCGGQLWPAGMVLAEHLLRDLDGLRGKVM